jgi:clan AA aspartic protease
MITGTVSVDREPIIRISVQDTHGQSHELNAVIDTGFNGWLTLPPELVGAFGLSWRRVGTAILADGSQTFFDVFEATVLWDGQLVTVSVDEAASEPLVGMSLMYGYELLLPVIEGGTLSLRKM